MYILTPHIDAENILPRLETRQKATGRPFKLDKILTRHRQFAENLDEYLNMFDLSVVLDNNKKNTIPSITAISHKGETTVFDEETYEKVKRKSQLNASATNTEELWARNSEYTTKKHIESEPRTVGTGIAENRTSRKKVETVGYFSKMIEDQLIIDCQNSKCR